MEGEIDTSHLGFLHGGLAQGEDPTLANRAPKYKVVDSEAGVLYGAFREQDEQHLNWRFASFSLPFWTQPATRSRSRGAGFCPDGRYTHHVVLHLQQALCPVDVRQ